MEQGKTGFPKVKNRDIFKFDKAVLFTTLRLRIIYIIFFSLLFFFVAGLASKFLITDKWEVRTVLLRNKKNMALQTDVPYLYQDLDMNTVVQTIKLRRNLQEVINRLSLDTTPEKLYRQINVELGRKSNIIHILTTDSDVEKAINTGNTLAEVFITSFIPIQNSSAGKIFNYYNGQKEDLLKKVAQYENELDLFNKEKKVLSIESETTMKFEQLKELELQKIENSMMITDYKTKLDDYSAEIKQLPEEVILTSTVKTSLERQMNIMKERLAELKEKYTEDNPKVIKLRSEIDKLALKLKENKPEKRVADEVTYGSNSIRETLVKEMNVVKAQLKSSEKKIAEYDIKIGQIQGSLQFLSESQKEYYTIKRQLELYKELLKTVENRIMEAKIAKESNISDFEILEYASQPPFPIGSKRKIMAVIAGILGFILSAGFIVFRELMDFSFKSPFDIKEQIGIPCAGNIPDKDQVKLDLFYAQFHVLLKDVVSSVSESGKPPLIVFGSDSENAGKSFIIKETVNFLCSLKKRVLYVETVYSAEEKPDRSIINRMLSDDDMFKNMKVSEYSENADKVFFLADSEALKTVFDKNRVQSFLNFAFESYDIVIWELFPFGFNIQLASDIIAASSKSYLVAKFRTSDIDRNERIVEFLRENDVQNISGILNKVDRQYLQVNF